MRIAPVNPQNNNANFKGASASLAKYPQKLQDTITSSISDVLETISVKGSKKTEEVMSPFYDKVTDRIADGIGTLSNTKLSKNIIETLGTNFKKLSARMADLASFAITFFYVNNTRKSEKIEEERKMPLMINNITVTIVSTIMAALIDKGSDVVLDRVKGAFYQQKGREVLDEVIKRAPEVLNKNEKEIQELAKDILNSREFRKGLKDYTKCVEKAKSLTIFAFVVRFLVTVLMVPVAGKIVKIVKDKMANAANTNKQNTQQTQQENKTQQTETHTQKDDDDKEEDDDD